MAAAVADPERKYTFRANGNDLPSLGAAKEQLMQWWVCAWRCRLVPAPHSPVWIHG